MFAIEFTSEAEADLAWFKKQERNIILDGIEENLRFEPEVITRNRKRLRPNQTAEWELRVDKYRVFYDVTDVVRIVSVEAVGLKIGNQLYFRGKERELGKRLQFRDAGSCSMLCCNKRASRISSCSRPTANSLFLPR
ncbi:addiction module toxin RelE [Candidatus Gracilibacteria bacterium]|nr:addiction module toxin RelE [Candidatus Gracilibacteria bacterium]